MIGRDFLSQLSAAPAPSGSRAMSASYSSPLAQGGSPAGRSSSLGGFMSDGHSTMQPGGPPMLGSSFGRSGGKFGSAAPITPAASMAPPRPVTFPQQQQQPNAARQVGYGSGLGQSRPYASLLSLLRGYL